jgi:diguanylate cyclase (GGDEF)-like protein/PAS domain S-box-containing protein
MLALRSLEDVSLLRAIVETARDPLLVFDHCCRVILCNHAAVRIVGKSERELVGRPLWTAAPEMRWDEASHKRPWRGEDPIVNRDGEAPNSIAASVMRAGAWTIHPILDHEGRVTGGFCVNRDAGDAEAMQRQLAASERRFRDFAECASDWFWETDQDLCYSYVSERYQEATGLTPASRLGRRRGDFRLDGPEDGNWAAHLADLDARRPFRDFAFAYLDASGQRRVAKVSGCPVFDTTGQFTGYRGVGRDITAEMEAERQIRFLAQHDALTGLPNRALLKHRLRQVLACTRRSEGPKVAVLCVDLDDFKTVNDTLGHAAGDELLCDTARRMRDAARESDTVARLGGDEFAIIQTDVHSWEDARTLAQRLIESLADPTDFGGEQVHCGASIGISVYPDDGHDADELIRHADLALYKAKSMGRNSFCFFLPAMNEEIHERRKIEDDLRTALKQDSFELYFQPQLDLSTGHLIGLETLLRCRHPQRGLLTPGTFMAVAERSGMILPIDRWVLRQTCAQAAAWRRQGLLDQRIAVNLSALTLARADLAQHIASVLAETGLPPSELEIEITESVLLTDTEAAAKSLTGVHELGVHLSVDDFGTGYSSLTYLRRFPVQKVKIDQTFVRDLCTDPENACIAKAIISLGHSLGLRVVAEGVETKRQLDYLRDAGCDEAQGYFIARPMSTENCEIYLRELDHARKPISLAQIRKMGPPFAA